MKIAIFLLSGWLLGVVVEYILHVIMHRRSLKFHINHHHQFFVLEPRQVALNDLSPRLNILFLGAAIVLASPLMLKVGVLPVLLVWAGVFWHLIVVYEGCHALIHYDYILPGILKRRGFYKWWRGCHIEHHRHSPAGNFCVSFPVLDLVFGTYVPPRP